MNLNLRFYFRYLCPTRVSDFVLLFRRLIMARFISVSSFYSVDCFDRGVILFDVIFYIIYIYIYYIYIYYIYKIKQYRHPLSTYF